MESCNLVRSLASHSSGVRSAEIQLSSVSAKTRVLPPITYWEKYSGPQGSANHAESVWRHLKFHLKLRITSVGIRYFNLHCFPLHPFGQSPEAIEFSWSVSGGQLILAGIRVGIKSGEQYVDLRLRAEGRYTPGLVRHPRSIPNHWTTIPESLRDAMRSAGGLVHLRIVLEDKADLPMLESFFSSTLEANEPLRRPETQYSNLQVAIERQPSRPQTNPHLDPLVYDPFPGIPIRLGSIAHELPEAKSKSSTPGEYSQALAAMELSDGGAEDGDRNGDHPKTPSSDIGSKGSSSSAWSFLGKSRGQNASSSSSSSSSSQPLTSLPPPPSPPVVSKKPPVVVKLEPESDSDTHIVETRKRKSNRLGDTGEGEGNTGEVRVKEKRKKKRRDVVESILVEEEEEEAHDDNEEAEGGDEEAEAERKRKRKERKKKRRNKDLDGDIDMETDVQSVDARPTKKKSKKSRRKAPISTSGSPISIQSPPPKKKTKKKGKEKSKEKQPEFRSDDRPSPPPIEPSISGSETRKHTKRKHLDSDSGDNNNDEVDSERLSRRRERLKKRINEINMEKHELRVEEEELKAKLLRLDFTTRQLDTGTIRAHCVCSACKKYGHKKNSVICEMHPDAIRIAAWRGR